MASIMAVSGVVTFTGAYTPLVAGCGEMQGMPNGLLDRGNVHAADLALGFLLDLGDCCRGTMCQPAFAPIEAGFPCNDTLSESESCR